ncbi:MAG TPA: ROK family transcriptional regulator [Dongiaceae bacterium]|jgi:predicted NBD/HSP70 family sugar kinase|nr:ROK family transcriptional regulator [Dongiaceae bacterium]
MSTPISIPRQPQAKRAIRAIAGTNLDGASAHNRRVIFDALRINGALTRADLARATQLTPQTVSNIVDSLRADGLVIADEPRRQGRGQPARPYRILPGGACAIGVQLDRHQMLGVVVDLAGAPLTRRQRQLPAGGPKKGGAALLKLIAELRASVHGRRESARLLGLGIAMPGPFGTMDGEDPWGMQDWQDFPLADWLGDKTGLVASVQNDAAAGAIAEKMYGAAAGLENFVHLFIGYGLGAGLVLRGEVYAGAANNAGEIGQVVSAAARTGNPEAIEHYASLLALCRHLEIDPRREGLLDHLQKLFEADDKRIRPWIAQAVRHLRHAVQTLESLFDPETIIIGGQMPPGILAAMVTSLEPLLPSIAHRRERAHPRLTVGATGLWSAALGAAMQPISRTFDPQFGAILKVGASQ